MDVIMENILGLGLGLGLAAACGFRVFVPLFFVGLAHRVGHLELATNFDWMSSNVALCCFGGAMMFEVLFFSSLGSTTSSTSLLPLLLLLRGRC